MSNYHPAFDSQRVQWSQNYGQFVAQGSQRGNAVALPARTTLSVPSQPGPRPRPRLIDEMDFWENTFPAAMNQLASAPEPQYGIELQDQWSIRRAKTWADVQAKTEMAHLKYDFHFQDHRIKRSRQTLRRITDKVAPYFTQSLKVVPESEFTSPVLKVLGLVLDAYKIASEVRNEVEVGFDNIPVVFAKVEFYHHAFQGDENIFQVSVGLVLATLKAVEESVKFYVSGQLKRAGKVVAKGEDYQQNLRKALQEMQTSSTALDEQAGMSFQHYMLATGDQTRQGIWGMQHTLEEVRQNQAWLANLFNSTFELFNQGVWLSHSAMSSRSTTPNPPLPLQHLQYPPEHLLAQMHMPDIDTVDLHRVFHSATDLHLEDRGRAQQVLSSPLFRAWLLSRESAKLLVHGDFESANRITPLSALCGTLVEAFRSVPENMGLVFFCGAHLHGDEYAGAVWMVRSLVAQVLRQYPQTIVRLDGSVGVEQIERGDVAALCTLFDVLLRQLPAASTVLCIIDGINEYEDKEYLLDMESIILTLLDLVDDRGRGGGRLKLLFVGSQPTTEVRKVFDEEPGTLLHMQLLPLIEDSMQASVLQERLESEIMYSS